LLQNRLYYKGLEAAIALKRAKGEPVHVLDIGTGTGLLSMMAAKIGADSVTAVEEFRPMADCATRVIAANGFADQIKLVRKRSTNVQVGEGLDMERRANILVTEVFDTELIGEAAISIFNHAHKILLTVKERWKIKKKPMIGLS
jgi:protein arginine N-methyltransferase 7